MIRTINTFLHAGIRYEGKTIYARRTKPDSRIQHKPKSKNHGVYIMLISGELVVADSDLRKRDALGIWQTELIGIRAKEDSEILLIEVPMVF